MLFFFCRFIYLFYFFSMKFNVLIYFMQLLFHLKDILSVGHRCFTLNFIHFCIVIFCLDLALHSAFRIYL